MANAERYSLSYRSKETRHVMEWVQAGQCGSIIGLRGTGKSNFVQFLIRKDIKRQYLGQNSETFHFIPINLLALTEQTEWGIYEILLSNLVAQLHPPDWESTTLDEMSSSYREMLARRDVVTAQRAFEHYVTLMSQQATQRLVFIFDEFDDVFRNLPAVLFRCLRAMRDAHKDQISFIVTATHELTDLRGHNLEEVDHFYRLVSRSICWLGPYSDMDAQEMICYLADRHSRILTKVDMTRLIELSGGHAGLIKAILSLLWNRNHESGLKTDFVELINEPSIRRECHKIWGSLSEGEQSILCSLINNESIPQQKLFHLADRGLLQKPDTKPLFFSPLFGVFVKEQAPPPTKGTYINRSGHIVQIDGQRIDDLTELEFEILCYLYEGRGRLCTKDDIVKNVYRQRYNNFQGGVTDEALQALIWRLREKIEPDRSHPRYVITVRGEGYKFVAPSEDQ